jgi:hypothetical protein
MPLVLNFIVLMLVVCIIGALSVPFLILFIFGLRKKRRWMKWVGGLSAVAILSVALLAFGGVIYWFVHPWSDTTNPKAIAASFKSNFGFEPGPDFVALNQRVSGLADSGSMHMQFRASSNTFERIRALGFSPIAASSFISSTGGGSPKWWITNPSENCYENQNWKGNFHANWAYFYYDKSSGQIFFYSLGID